MRRVEPKSLEDWRWEVADQLTRILDDAVGQDLLGEILDLALQVREDGRGKAVVEPRHFPRQRLPLGSRSAVFPRPRDAHGFSPWKQLVPDTGSRGPRLTSRANNLDNLDDDDDDDDDEEVTIIRRKTASLQMRDNLARATPN
jgi:hypothetical protein